MDTQTLMPTGNPNGRPTKCTDENIEIANNYLTDFNEVHFHQIPSMVGLAVVLKVGISTIYDWISDERNGFPDIASRLMDNQHFTLTNHGLDGTFNSSITKLLLTKHGYSDSKTLEANINDYTGLSSDERQRMIAERSQALLQSQED